MDNIRKELKPKRVTPAKSTAMVTNTAMVANTTFQLPHGELNLEFFLKKEGSYTPDQIIKAVFGDIGMRMTEQEKVSCLLDAMESLEITMPFEFECPECNKPNPIAIEVSKVKKTEGAAMQSFRIEVANYIFEFERPPETKDTKDIPGLAGIGLYIMQWLVGHNQGPDFEFIHLPIKIILKLAEEFTKHMFRVSFSMESQCVFCKAKMQEEFYIGMDDLTAAVNEI